MNQWKEICRILNGILFSPCQIGKNRLIDCYVTFFIFIKIHRLTFILRGTAFENLILIANTSSCDPISISFFIDSYETFRRNESAQVDNPSSKLSVSFLPRRNGASGGCEQRRRPPPPLRIPVTGSKRKTRLANRSRALSNERNEPVITRWTCNTSGNLSFLPRTWTCLESREENKKKKHFDLLYFHGLKTPRC